jgi:hypothetical protein
MQVTQPLQIVMSRDGSDADHEALRDARGTILDEPRVGHAVQVYFDDGKWMRTSPVRAYARQGSILRVETANSTYRLKIVA